MASTDWCMVRIRKSTLERLKAQRESLLRAYEQGKYEAKQRHDRLVPLDDVINAMLDREAAKKARATKSARAKRSKAEVSTLDTSAQGEG